MKSLKLLTTTAVLCLTGSTALYADYPNNPPWLKARANQERRPDPVPYINVQADQLHQSSAELVLYLLFLSI